MLRALLTDYTFQTVALGAALLGLVSGVLGSFAVLRRQSLLGDGVSHAALPGVVAAFLLTGSKNTEILLAGALATGLLGTLLITAVTRRSRVKFDSALAIVMSVFFGGGLVLLTLSQRIPDANQAGLSRFIYGQASALLRRDVVLMVICGALLLSVMLLFWKEFKLLCFDPQYAAALGRSTGFWSLLLSFLTVLAIIIGLQTVGVVLMSAMLITPAVAARQWCTHLWSMVTLSAVFGAASGVVGTAASSLITQLPTGPTIVICISAIALVSLFIAPGRGILARALNKSRGRARLIMERRDGHGPFN